MILKLKAISVFSSRGVFIEITECYSYKLYNSEAISVVPSHGFFIGITECILFIISGCMNCGISLASCENQVILFSNSTFVFLKKIRTENCVK